jgi:protein-S-isoprenylcysteine O-methyltransferase Ste14
MDITTRFAIGCWAVVIAFWILSAFSVKRTSVHEKSPHRWLYLALMAVVAFLLAGSARKIHWDRIVLRHSIVSAIFGDLILFVGLLIALWARVALGDNWSARVTLKENHELIQRGPYCVVRHPIYSGLLLMILGTAVLGGRADGFVALAFCFCGLWVKLRREEALLTKYLPGYSEYRRRTRALVPFVL